MAFYKLILLHALYTSVISVRLPTCSVDCKDYEIRTEYLKDQTGYLHEFSCSCDTMCKYFNDCCAAALANPEELADGFDDLSLDLMSCIAFPEISTLNWLYYVDRCPSTWSGEMVRKSCENNNTNWDDFILRVPVTGHKTGLLYKNMYCAICHRLTYLFWVTVVNCDHDPLMTTENITLYDVHQVTGCFLKFEKPAKNVDYRQCLSLSKIVDTCSPTYNDLNTIEKCEGKKDRGLELRFDKTTGYRNQYCVLCNTENAKRGTCEPSNSLTYFDQYKFYPFVMMIDMNKLEGTVTRGTKYARVTENITSIRACLSDEMFDPFDMTCVAIRCDTGLVVKDGVCQYSSNSSDCTRFQLDQTEYIILDNGDLFELSSKLHYAKSLYYIKQSSAFVCTGQNQKRIAFRFSPTEIVISIAGLSVSLPALFVTIITYSAFSSLRNTTGKNILSLACSLFVSNLLMLVSPNMEDVVAACKGIAICMHYFFLASFFWMNAMAVDTLITVSKIRNDNTTTRPSHRFYFYCIYSWIGPALIVLCSLLVEYLLVYSELKPNYGIGLCWLTNKKALLVFFVGPTFFIILINAVLFAVIATKIYRIRNTGTRIQADDKTTIFICAKLFVVIGLTWTVGFIANLIPHPVLWYLFIVLNTLQGLFIFLSFVTTKKVWRLVWKSPITDDEVLENGPAVTSASLSVSPIQKTTDVASNPDDKNAAT